MKPGYILLSLIALFSFSSRLYSETDSSQYNVLKYSIHLDILDFNTHVLSGKTLIQLVPSEDKNYLHFMLKKLTVDEITLSGIPLVYAQNGDVLEVRLPATIPKGDTIELDISYQGVPAKDPQWGGFYFSAADGGYAYNMGVGFADDPHNYGRVWFPCKDNFTDKAIFDFYITTPHDKKAICSGIFINKEIHANNSITWHWFLEKEIPTYLASVAVADYELLEWNHQGLNKSIHVLLGAVASDTSNLKSSFANLNSCIDIFESKYLPYQFDRVGFVVVPFNSGAMEHACNIAYPKYAVNGNLSRETLMAHEFAHQWWGNLVTCASAEEMWINEGWASYSENIFTEYVYGRQAYLEAVKANHKYVLQYTHIRDDEARALFPLPHDYTYGSHAYDKGSDVAHTLRGYLGDSLFFSGIHKFLDRMKFLNCSSSQFRDSLSEYTSYDLTDFFANWVFEKGFPHYALLVKRSWPTVEIDLIPSLRFTSKPYLNVPLTVSFFSDDFKKVEKKITMNGKRETFAFSLNFEPVFIAVNMDAQISEAKTSNFKLITAPGTYDFREALMKVDVNQLNDSALLFVEHNWVEPSHWNSSLKGIRFSDYRYWTVSGILPSEFFAEAEIKYNGSQGNINGDNYLDHTLHIINEDSLILMYREKFNSPWVEYPDYDVNTGHKTNKIGDMTIHRLKLGDYCLAKYDYTVDLGAVREAGDQIKIFPNPSKNMLTIDMPINHKWKRIRLFNINGQLIEEADTNYNEQVRFNLEGLVQGPYILEFSNKLEKDYHKFILEF